MNALGMTEADPCVWFHKMCGLLKITVGRQNPDQRNLSLKTTKKLPDATTDTTRSSFYLNPTKHNTLDHSAPTYFLKMKKINSSSVNTQHLVF